MVQVVMTDRQPKCLNLDKIADYTDDEVFFFIRVRGKASYFKKVYTQQFIECFKSLTKHRTLSEYKKDATVHICLESVDRDWLLPHELEVLGGYTGLSDIIRRCRGLRAISHVEAAKLVSRATLFFLSFYEAETKLKLIVTGTIDNYVMDIMARLGAVYGVKFLAITDSFMTPQYKLISLRGEHSVFRAVPDVEVEAVLATLKSRLREARPYSKIRATKFAAYTLISYCVRFFVRYVWHYKIFGRLAYEYRFATKFSAMDNLSKLFGPLLYEEEAVVDELKNQFVYVPLHFSPEATVDYWVADDYHCDYDRSVLAMITSLVGDGREVIVKEHPAFFLLRSKSFYAKIKAAGAHIVSPFCPTEKLMACAAGVLVWNGSTGIEALVRGIPVSRVVNSYYGDGLIPVYPNFTEQQVGTFDSTMGSQALRAVLSSSFKVF